MKHFGQSILLGLATVLAACGIQAMAATPPEKVLIADFSVPPNIVQLDTSPGVAMQRSAAGVSAQQARMQDVSDVQEALAETLMEKIQAMGLSAERVAAGTQPSANELLVTGQITSIREGNHARRTMIGFGAGKSAVEGSAELLQGTAAGPQLLQTFNLSVNSGHMPGMGVGAAAGGVKSVGTAISGGVHVAEAPKSSVGKEAASIADRLSSDLRPYFVAQHWIAPSEAAN